MSKTYKYRFKIEDLTKRQIEMIFQLIAQDIVFLNGFMKCFILEV